MTYQQGDFVITPEMILAEVKERRKRLDGNKPKFGSARYVGEGLGDAVAGLAYGAKNARLDDIQGRAMGANGDLMAAVLASAKSKQGAIPAYQNGTGFHPGGLALVGEQGPEVVNMPRGSQVYPNAGPNETVATFANDMQRQMFEDMTPDEKNAFLERVMGGYSVEEALQPPGWSNQGSVMPEPDLNPWGRPVSQAPSNAPGRIPDAGRPEVINPNYFDGSGPGVVGGAGQAAIDGQQGADYLQGGDIGAIKTQASSNSKALAIKQSLMAFGDSLDDYERIFREGGGAVMPGPQRDNLEQQRVALQMQMKDLYELGALQGPDMELLNNIIGVDPTAFWPNVLDKTGISDLDKRFNAGTDRLRDVMMDLAAPKLREYGIDVRDIASLRRPVDQMSDDDFLKSLGLQ